MLNFLDCEANIHFDCVLKLGEKCGGKGKKRDTKRLSVIPKIQRKPGGSSPSGATGSNYVSLLVIGSNYVLLLVIGSKLTIVVITN